MFRSYLLLRNYSPGISDAGDEVDDPYATDDATPPGGASDPPAGGSSAPPAVSGTTSEPDGVGVGPALGEAGKSAVVPLSAITGNPSDKPAEQPAGEKPVTTGSEGAAGAAAATSFAGFAGGANEFAEKILGQKDGVIFFEDTNEKIPFAELNAEEQQAIISQHVQSQPTAEERTLLNEIRQVGGVQNFVQRRAADLAEPTSLTNDEVSMNFIKREHPNATQEELDRLLAHEKSNPYYERKLSTQRETLNGEAEKRDKDLEEADERMLVMASRSMETVANINLTDEIREQLLEDILTPDKTDPSTTAFLKKFENPQELIRLAWLDRYGEPLLRQFSNAQPRRKPASTAPDPISTRGSHGTPQAGGVDDVYSG